MKYKLFVLILFTVFTQSCFGNDYLFAINLIGEKDYYRAISVLKRVLYYSQDDETKLKVSINLAEAYLMRGQFKESISQITDLLNNYDLSTDYQHDLYLILGLNYYGLKAYGIADNFFNEASSILLKSEDYIYKGLLLSEQEHWGEASEAFKNAAALATEEKIKDLSLQMGKLSNSGVSLPKKSSFIAGFLSTIIPGAGQLYTGHTVDALQSFIMVGAFSFATYCAFRYEHEIVGNYPLTVIGCILTASFHLANIYGATVTSLYYNNSQNENLKKRIRKGVFSISFNRNM